MRCRYIWVARGQANTINAREVKSLHNGENKNQKNHSQTNQPSGQKNQRCEKPGTQNK